MNDERDYYGEADKEAHRRKEDTEARTREAETGVVEVHVHFVV